MKKALQIALGVVVFVVIVLAVMKVNYDAAYASLVNRGNAEQQNAKLTFDTMWQTFKGKAQVAENYRATFEKVYPEIMEARYGKGGNNAALLKFVKESNPEYSNELLKDLGRTIEGKREEFLQQQRVLVDVQREINNLRTVPPACYFEGSRPEFKIRLVTSQSTNDTFETGIEEDQPIFSPTPVQ